MASPCRGLKMTARILGRFADVGLIAATCVYCGVVIAAAQAPECLNQTDTGRSRILIVSGQIEEPERQVRRLNEALARARLDGIPVDLELVDELDPARLPAQLDRIDLDNRRAIVTLSGHIARALTARSLSSPTLFVTILD